MFMLTLKKTKNNKRKNIQTNNKEEGAMKNKRITKRTEDYSQWYLDVIAAADLADNSPVKGCMVIKPYGYGIIILSGPIFYVTFHNYLVSGF